MSLALTAAAAASALSTFEWLFLIVLLYVLHMFLDAFLLSPIRHVPGPWYTRVSKLPLLYATFKARRTPFTAGLVDHYGSIVVLAPRQIHTTDEEAMKIIYDRTSLKTQFYKSMGSWKGVTSTLGFIDYPSAAPTRNNLISCFQNKNLASLVESIESHIADFISIVRSKSEADETLDGIVYFRLLALDVVTDVLWAEETRLLQEVSHSTPDLLRRFHAFSRWNALKSFMPAIDLFVRCFGTRTWRQLRSDCSDMDITARQALNRWDNKNSRHDRDVLSMLKSMQQEEDPRKHVPNDHIPAYMVEMLAAGSSTTSLTVAFTCWLLARDGAVQDRLREELAESFPDKDHIDLRKSVELPFLDAVIKETMRMYPAIPGPLERHLGKPIVVDGKNVPKGIIASTAAYTQGRLPDVFPNPGSWEPVRWLEATERMNLNWIPFGYGSRACPGSNLALTEIKYMLATIFRLFQSVVPADHAQDNLQLADVFAAASKSGHCWVKFVAAEA